MSRSCKNQNLILIRICLHAENRKKTSHFSALQKLGNLKIFRADLTEEGSFDAPVAGSDLVFHVATPVNFSSQDPEVYHMIGR